MKVDGSLGSLVQGVSQQAPTQRRKGQHGEQVNMVPDAVVGLARRHGSQWQAEALMTAAPNSTVRAAEAADAKRFRRFEYSNGGRDLVVLYRASARPADSALPPVIVYDKTSQEFLTVVRNGVDATLDLLASGGASAITAIGKYVFMAGNSISAAGSSTDQWGATTNQQRTVLWVRGGAYSRTYKATVTKADDTQASFEYKTPTASYPGRLDTTGVSQWLPDPTGSSSGTTSALATASEVIGPKTNGSTYTLAHVTGNPTPNLTVSVHEPGTGELVRNLVRGADYGYVYATGVLTFRSDFTRELRVTYQYTVGGSTSTVVYGTEDTTEAAAIREVNGYGVADLSYAEWSPTNLTVRHGATALTNVAPALPTGPTEFHWNADDKTVTFHGSMVNNLSVSIKYTHIKVIANPNYSRQVGDITNAYNTAVTKWIGDSAAAIQPEAIAASLKAAAEAAGLTGVSVVGSTVVFTGVKDINANDGGDGTLLIGLANTVASVNGLTDLQHVGKIVKVQPTGAEAFYMKATAKNPAITSGVTEVLWVEGAGVTHTITSALIYGVASGSSFYLASSATLLNAILPGTHPTYAASTVGDNDTSPLPYFVGKKISYLGVFQDRLLVGADAVIRCSKVGDYLNFFRTSVLTLPANDPLQLLSQGADDDLIRYGVLYDRDLVLFGKRQYVISGRAPLTPTSGNMPVVSSHQGADDAQPVAGGSVIFYGKRGQNRVSVHQIEPGRNSDAPESFPVSSQLDDFIPGTPSDLTWAPKPTTLIVRTADAPYSLFLFSYLDNNARRLQDCWHRWDYADALDTLLGCAVVDEGLLVFTLRHATDQWGVYSTYAVADLQPLDSQLSTVPYLDSQRAWSGIVAAPDSLYSAYPGWSVAYNSSSVSRFMGVSDVSDTAAVATLITDLGDESALVIGKQYTSAWTPTNPLMRDNEERAINAGRLVVTALLVGFRDSSGFDSTVTAYGQDTVYRFDGRLIGSESNIVGRVPVTTGKKSVVVGREAQEYTQRFTARLWLPLTITAVDWTGQSYHRPQRVG